MFTRFPCVEKNKREHSMTMKRPKQEVIIGVCNAGDAPEVPDGSLPDPIYTKASLNAGMYIAKFNRKYKTAFHRVYMTAIEVAKPWKELNRTGFWYSIEQEKKQPVVCIDVQMSRVHRSRLSDAEYINDLTRTFALMFERVCWQHGLGTYVSRHPVWKKRKVSERSAFRDTLTSQRGTFLWDFVSGRKKRECEMNIVVPCSSRRRWNSIATTVCDIARSSTKYRVDESRYCNVLQSGEVTIVGMKQHVDKLPGLLHQSVYLGPGTIARVRPLDSDTKGKIVMSL